MTQRSPGADHNRDEAARAAREAADEVYRGILERAPEHEIDPTLDRVREVCELLGDPQLDYQVIHVTGTNGKTSTTRMIERLVREHGLRTGRFTSPHLTRVTERIAIDGEPISDEDFVRVWQDVAPYVHIVDQRSLERGGPRLSFFEVFTVMAFAAFADAPVDVAVVEVGMGGRWDSTNVVHSQVQVIAPVSMDHERYLGHTLAEVAGNKAGIIEDGGTVVVARQDEVAEGVILAEAATKGARVIREDVDIAVTERVVAVSGQMVMLRGLGGVYTDIYLSLHGEHQAHNALLALIAKEALLTGGAALDAGVVEAAFGDASSPGRLEVVRTSPTVLVDGAHNPNGAEALVAALGEAFAFDRLVGVVAVMNDKDPERLLGVLEPALDEIVVTHAGTSRSMDVDELAEIAEEVFGPDRVHRAERLDDALTLAVERAESEVEHGAGVLVTGSLYLVAEARILLGRP
ncbi:MAG TPA: folylpolyglutamate synthase/dihydrofolate synthase family protein [Cellulomonas sp.]